MNARGFGTQLDRLSPQRLLHGEGAAGALRRPVSSAPDTGRGAARRRADGTPSRRPGTRRSPAVGLAMIDLSSGVAAQVGTRPQIVAVIVTAGSSRGRARAGPPAAPGRALRAALDVAAAGAARAGGVERAARDGWPTRRRPARRRTRCSRRPRRGVRAAAPLLDRDLAPVRGDEDPRPGGRAARRRGTDGSRGGGATATRRTGTRAARASRSDRRRAAAPTTDQ